MKEETHRNHFITQEFFSQLICRIKHKWELHVIHFRKSLHLKNFATSNKSNDSYPFPEKALQVFPRHHFS